jgi:hypothetical protein
MRRLAVVVAIVVFQAGAVMAQQAELPKPTAEHQRLSVFVGNWTIEGEMKAGPTEGQGRITATDRSAWVPGNFFVQRFYEGKSPMGEGRGLEILGYDAVRKVYTYNTFDSIGTVGSGTMTVKDTTWTTLGTLTNGTGVMRNRCTLDFGSGATTLRIECEVSTDGTSWMPAFQGKATRTN